METILEPRLSGLSLLVMTAGLVIAYELCFRIGRRRREESFQAKKTQADVAVTALLALLGLMLAFSFQIGTGRFDKRKDLVLQEADAIGTTYRQAGLVPEPWRSRIRELLREYVDVRIEVTSPEAYERAVKESGTLHSELWVQAEAAAHASADSPVVALFISSLNHMIDLHDARVTVDLYQRMPPALFASLYLVALLSLAMVGLRTGLERERGALPAATLIAAIMCVMALIVSLDAPVSRLFPVSRHAITATQRTMTAVQPGAPAASGSRPDRDRTSSPRASS
jgi:hypothetical protein